MFKTLLLLAAVLLAGPAAKVGDRVEVEWNGKWYPAQVLETKDEQYKVHYEGYGSNWDEWVAPKRMRPLSAPKAAAPTQPAASAPASDPSDWRPHKGTGIVGTWVYQTLSFKNPDGSMLDASRDVWGAIHFDEHGVFTQQLRVGEFNNIQYGMYRLKGDKVKLMYEDGGRNVADELTFAIDGVRLSMIHADKKGGARYFGLMRDGSCHKGVCAKAPRDFVIKQ